MRPRTCAYAAIVVLVAIAAAASPGRANGRSIDPGASGGPAAGDTVQNALEWHSREIGLRNAIKAHPADPQLRLDLARLLLASGNYSGAEVQARAAQKAGGSDNDIAPVLAQSMLGARKYAELVELVRAGSRPPKDEAEVRAALGRAHLALGEMRFADPMIRDAARLDGAALGPKVAMVQLLVAIADMKGAKAEFARARALAPGDIDVLRLGAQMLELEGDSAGAVAGCDRVLAQWPDDLGALILRAAIRLNSGALEGARTDIDHILRLDRGLVVARYLDAVLLARKGKFVRAEEALKVITAYLGSFPDGLYLQGLVESRLGHDNGATEALIHYSTLRTDDVRASHLLAAIALKRNDTRRVVEVLQPVVDQHPGDDLAAALLGRAYALRGDFDRAFDAYDLAAQALVERGSAEAGASRSPAAKPPAEGAESARKAVDALVRSDLDPDSAAIVRVVADLKMGAVAEASEAAAAFLKRVPGDPVVEVWLAVIRLHQRRYGEAETILTPLVARQPKFLEARRYLARARAAAGRVDAAQAAWLDVLKEAPGDKQACFGLAQLALAAKDAVKAADWLQTAQRASQKSPAAGIAAIKLYAAAKDWQNADSLARGLTVLFPTDLQVIDIAAQVFAASGKADEAKALYPPLLDNSTSAAPLLASEARLFQTLGEKASARAALVKAVALDPKNLSYMAPLVDLNQDEKGVDVALKTSGSFAAAEPVAAALLGATVLIKANRAKTAIAELTPALAQHPASPLARLLAQLLGQDGRQAEAESVLERWLADHGGDWQARLELGNLYAHRHADVQAFAAYRQVHEQVPQNVIALNNLAWLAAKNSDPRAREWAERAYYLAPSAEAADTYGWILASAGAPEAGLAFLREAVASLPNDSSVVYHLAFALQAMGRKGEARTLLESALKPGTAFDGRADAQRLFQELQRD
jgi:putative PEP-CTERM system TPR-repeat lipoprotein